VGAVGITGNPRNDGGGQVREQSGFMGMAGAALRIGRAWDWYAVEAVGMFFLEHRDRGYDYTIAGNANATYDYNFQDQSDAPNAFLGVGGRVTSKDDSVRFTAGLAPGLMIRTFSPRRKQDNGGSPPTNTGGSSGNRFTGGTTNNGCTGSCGPSEQDFNGAGYTTFGFVLDGGILLGSTPGAKFYIGANLIVDFAPTLVVGPDVQSPIPDSVFSRPGRGILLTDGVNVYIGPTLGVQFGH
jgi:hypothetical protein